MSFYIGYTGGETAGDMESHEENRNDKEAEVAAQPPEVRGVAGSSASDTDHDGSTAKFYISSDEEEDAGKWFIVCRQRKGRGRMWGPDEAACGDWTPPMRAALLRLKRH